jgi:hypothetical protein
VKKDEAVKKNLALLNDFMQAAFHDTSLLERIPRGAQIVILPLDDPEMSEYNRRIARKLAKKGEQVMLIHLKRPAKPRIKMELLSA